MRWNTKSRTGSAITLTGGTPMKVVLALIVCLSVHAQVKPQFDTSLFAKRYLWYLQLENAFDSCRLMYTFGEIEVLDSTQSLHHLPFLSVRRDEIIPRCIYGNDETGIDEILQSRCTSHPFIAPPKGFIRFFRMTEGIIPCWVYGEVRDTLIRLPAPINTIERGFKVPQGCILDTTEFIVELIQLADDQVLAVLDSIGVLPNPTTPYPTRYGTEPLLRTVTRPLPASSWGKAVYLRIKPRRHGPTPLGLALRKYSAGWCLSLLYPNDDTLAYYPRYMERSFNRTGRDPLDTARNRAILAAIESQAQQHNGCVYYIPSFTSFSAQEDSIFFQAAIENIRARGYIYETDRQLPDSIRYPCQQQGGAAWSWYFSTFDDDIRPSARHPMLSNFPPATNSSKPPLTITNPITTMQPLTIASPLDIGPVTIHLYDVKGRLVLRTTAVLAAGITTISHALSAGVYHLVVESQKKDWKWYHAVVISP